MKWRLQKSILSIRLFLRDIFAGTFDLPISFPNLGHKLFPFLLPLAHYGAYQLYIFILEKQGAKGYTPRGQSLKILGFDRIFFVIIYFLFERMWESFGKFLNFQRLLVNFMRYFCKGKLMLINII